MWQATFCFALTLGSGVPALIQTPQQRGMPMRTRAFLLIVGALALSLLAAVAQRSSAAAAPTCPTFSSSNFHHSTRIDNAYSPLIPGDLYTYTGNLKKQQE